MAVETQDRRKHRVSNIFSRQKSREDFDERPSPSPNGADSAYASSDPSSQRTSPENAKANTVRIENHGQISGVAEDRNLALNKTTGEVLDNDTGEVITTVTTTTTTTTTTVRKGKGVDKGTTVEVQTRPGNPDGSAQLVEAPGDSRLKPETIEPQRRSPAPIQVAPPPLQNDIPPPLRNPNRKSREYIDPPSPAVRTNFSHPSRSDLRGGQTAAGEENGYQQHEYLPQPLQPGPHSRPSQPSTYDNLKAAAVGLHGVGETLRGTLNSSVDSRFPRHNADKATAADAKNRADLEKGQREMARLREVNGLRPTVTQQSGSSAPNEQSQRMNASGPPHQLHPPGTWGSGRAADIKGDPAIRVAPLGTHPAYRSPPPPDQQQRPPDSFAQRQENARQHQDPAPRYDGTSGQGAAGQVQAVSHVQGSNNGVQTVEPEEERKGLRKLFKRKGVGA